MGFKEQGVELGKRWKALGESGQAIWKKKASA